MSYCTCVMPLITCYSLHVVFLANFQNLPLGQLVSNDKTMMQSTYEALNNYQNQIFI